MNWFDCQPFVDTLAARGLLGSEVPEDLVELLWHIWQAGSGHGALEVWERVQSGEPLRGPVRAVVQGVPEDVLKKARRLQALALNESAAPQERENAWAAFSKIWQEYQLPGDFGL